MPQLSGGAFPTLTVVPKRLSKNEQPIRQGETALLIIENRRAIRTPQSLRPESLPL
jgi:hypothetical protein